MSISDRGLNAILLPKALVLGASERRNVFLAAKNTSSETALIILCPILARML